MTLAEDRTWAPDVECQECGRKLSEMAEGGPAWHMDENVTLRHYLTVRGHAGPSEDGIEVNAYDSSTEDGFGDAELVCPAGHLVTGERAEDVLSVVTYG